MVHFFLKNEALRSKSVNLNNPKLKNNFETYKNVIKEKLINNTWRLEYMPEKHVYTKLLFRKTSIKFQSNYFMTFTSGYNNKIENNKKYNKNKTKYN